MIHPTIKGLHPNVRMIGYFPARYFFSEAKKLGFHPTHHPMNHPRIILMISEPDQDVTIILVSSQSLETGVMLLFSFSFAIILISSYGFRVQTGSLKHHPIVILVFGTATGSKMCSSYCHPSVFPDKPLHGGISWEIENIILPNAHHPTRQDERVPIILVLMNRPA